MPSLDVAARAARATSAMADLDVKNVRVKYGSSEVVSDVSFHLESGKTLALLGPSGCGKTTLLNSIAGFVDIDSGTISLQGLDMSRTPVRKRGLSMVFQTHALFPHLTVIGNVLFGLRVGQTRKRLTAVERDRAARALALVRLDDLADRYPNELSGGQRQRVALARALVVKPKVMLLDEPLSSLDAKLRAEMRIELRELQRNTGVTMVYVTHDKDEAFALGDYIGIMRQGRLVQIGTPESVCQMPNTAFAASFLLDSNLLPGRVVDVNTLEGTCTVEVPGPRSSSKAVAVRCRNPHALAQGSTTTVAVAPAAISVARDAGIGGVPVRMRIAQFMGEAAHVVAEFADREILAKPRLVNNRLPAGLPGPGGTVWMTWSVEDAIALPESDSNDIVRRMGSGMAAGEPL